jgi:hypothetical protein
VKDALLLDTHIASGSIVAMIGCAQQRTAIPQIGC